MKQAIQYVQKSTATCSLARHIEVVELYKSQILILECELEHYKQEANKYERLLLDQLGIMQNRAEVASDHQPVHKAMSPLRMRMQLEQASKLASIKK